MTSTPSIIQCIQRRVKGLQSWMKETLRFARLSTWSRSGNARCVLSIAVQELYTAHVDILWQKILPRIESTSQLCLTPSPYRTSTSESTDHTVTGMEKHLDVKITLRRINLQRNAVKKKYDRIHDRYIRDITFRKAMIEVGRSEQIIKEMDQLASEDHTYKATKEEIDPTSVAIGGSTRIWHALIQYRQGMNPNLKVRCQTMRRLKRAEDEKKQETWTQKFLPLVFLALACKLVGVRFWVLASKMVWPLIARGNPFLGGSISICGKSLNVQRI